VPVAVDGEKHSAAARDADGGGSAL